MLSHNWKFRIGKLAVLASFGLASTLYSKDDDSLPPVITSGAARSVNLKLDDQMVGIPTSYDVRKSDVEQVSYRLNSYQATPSCGCESGSCDSGCSSCSDGCSDGCATACCLPWWAHRSGGFAEGLYLSAGNSDLIYAVEQTGPNPGAQPTGPLGITNVGEHLGYRAGFTFARSNCSSVIASYTRWDGETTSAITAAPGNVLNSTLIHPSIDTTGAASLDATARQLANFQFADVMIRRVYRTSDCGVINWLGGARYGKLKQTLSADQIAAVANGLTNTTSDIDFNGFGIIGGLDGERHSSSSGFLVYGRVLGSLLAGNWQADYRQTNQFGGGVIANRYRDYRVTPVLDSELGLGWQNKTGRIRLTTGYLFSTWFNAVTTRDYIQSFRSGNMLNLDDNLTFSGFTFKTDFRF